MGMFRAFIKTSIIPVLKNRNVTPVTKIIIDQLQLSQQCPNCLNCVYQNCWILSWLQVITNLVFKRKHATDLCIYTVKSVIKYYNYFSSLVYTCFPRRLQGIRQS